MLAGALLGALAAWFGRGGFVEAAGAAKPFAVAIAVIIGIVLGRLFAAVWANRRLKALNALLYEKAQPEEFIRRFSPIVERTPRETVEYVDGCNKLSYAHEALGEFDRGLSVLSGLEPEKLKLHSLAASSLVSNQRTRLYLLTGDTERAKEEIGKLEELSEAAGVRAPSLAANLKQCLTLFKTWLSFLEGGELDRDYIGEEIALAANLIHKNEMRLLLVQAGLRDGDRKTAEKLLAEICETGDTLYAQREARKLMSTLT